MQINRFTRALNQRSLTELSELLSPALQEKGLASFLASLPMYFGTVTSEVSVPEDPSGTYVVIFSTERGPRYTAAMAWQETAGFLVLPSFHLTPAGPGVPRGNPVPPRSLSQDLRLPWPTKNGVRWRPSSRPICAQDPGQSRTSCSALAEGAQWEIVQISLEPFTVMWWYPRVPPSLLLQLDLTPGLTTGCSRDWKLCPCLSVWTRCTIMA